MCLLLQHPFWSTLLSSAGSGYPSETQLESNLTIRMHGAESRVLLQYLLHCPKPIVLLLTPVFHDLLHLPQMVQVVSGIEPDKMGN